MENRQQFIKNRATSR